MSEPVSVSDPEGFLPAIDQFARIGTFDVTLNFIDLDSDASRALFSQVIVVKTEHDLVRKQIRYTAIATFFEPINAGDPVPHYLPHITRWPDGVWPRHSIAWKRA